MPNRRDKRARKQDQQAAYDARRRKHCVELLKLMGIAELVARLPASVQEYLWRHRLPRPVVEIEPASVSHPSAAAVRDRLQKVLDEALMK